VTRILLVGLMGTGKTTLASAIAGQTGWPCIDNDAVLERSTGSTAAELLARDGEERLRSAESDVLTLLLSMPGPFVAGVAAGTVLDPLDRERTRAGGHVVWVRTPVATLVRRVARQPRRAWLQDDPAKVLRAMAQEREPLYEQMAHQVLDMERLSVPQAAQEVVAAVQSG
jgi:shikimate kinase